MCAKSVKNVISVIAVNFSLVC